MHALTCKKHVRKEGLNCEAVFPQQMSLRTFQTFDMNYILFSKLFSLDANSIRAKKYFLIIHCMPRSMAGTMGDIKIFL